MPKYLDEFADPVLARALLDDIARTVTQPWAVMEVCGGQTHTIIRNGIDQLLPEGVELIHGPGCPVCVTPLETIDRALAIAATPDVIFCSFGDMLRVPGSERDLYSVKAAGGDVRVVYSPLDAVRIAQANPDKQVVFFAIGFETTAPANAMTVLMADRLGLTNFSLVVSHVLVPPAIRALLESPSRRVQGFLAAGHVCTVMGLGQYAPLVEQYHVPIVVTGFEPLDVLEGIRRVLGQLEAGEARARQRVPEGGVAGGQPRGAEGRGPGVRGHRPGLARDRHHPGQRLAARPGVRAVRRREAVRRQRDRHRESPLCRSGEVLQGLIKPSDCEAFGTECTPRQPARRPHGLERRCLRGLLPLPPAHPAPSRPPHEGAPVTNWPSAGAPRRVGNAAAEGPAAADQGLDLESWSCPLPLRDFPTVVMGHGGGGRLSGELIEHLFVPAFTRGGATSPLSRLGDGAVVPPAALGSRSPPTTYVVRPRFFPGGCIGDLAVNGTVNDLAMCGSVPLFLTAGFILEEGVPLDEARPDRRGDGAGGACGRRADRHRRHEGRRLRARRRRLHQHRGRRPRARRGRRRAGARPTR